MIQQSRVLARDLVRCDRCRHRQGAAFETLSAHEQAFLSGFKLGRESVPAGTLIGRSDSPLLFTLYSGWAARSSALPAVGSRCVGIALPGDLIRLGTLRESGAPTEVQALTDLTYCRFDPARWGELMAIPSLAEKVHRIEAQARRAIERHLLAAIHLPASGLFCHFVVSLYDGLRRRNLAREGSFRVPLSRLQIATALGLSAMHLRRILAELARAKVMEFDQDCIRIGDLAALRHRAGGFAPDSAPQPLI